MSMNDRLRRCLYDAGLAVSGLGPAQKLYRTVVTGDVAQLAVQYRLSILRHAASHVPYYQGLDLGDRSLRAYPILSKASLREHSPRLMAQASRVNASAVRVRSGGSTGEPITAWLDLNALQWDFVGLKYYRHVLLGIDLREHLSSRKVALWDRNSRIPGRATDLRLRIGRLVSRTTYLNPCVISEELLGAYVQRINKLRPKFITAYASSLYELACFASRRGLGVHRPQMIFVSGDTLFPAMRSRIEQVFGCRIINMYGSREAGLVAGECLSGRLHILSFNSTVEVVDDNGEPVAAGRAGRLLVTSHHNYAMPLIRYDTGDLAAAAAGVCECGNPLPFLGRIVGRVVEHFPTADGNLVTGGYFFHLFYGHDWVLEFHILQEELDRVVVFYTRDHRERRRDEDMEQIAAGIRRVMGDGCKVEWREVDRIPRTPHGKRLFTRSLVWEDRHAELLQDMTADRLTFGVDSGSGYSGVV